MAAENPVATQPSPDRAPGVRFDHLTKRYPRPGQEPTVAVEDVNLSVEPGSLTVLVGSSGSGKTTLLRSVNRMVTPTSGRVLIDGRDTAELDPVKLRRTIGYVMQESGLLPHRRVIDNIATVPRLNGVKKAPAQAHARELMHLVGLDPQLAARYPAELSGGQQQRVGVARALAANPKLLLMDEPFGAVDPIVRADLQREIRELQRKLGITILFVTHDIAEALALGDHIVVLAEKGRIEQQGTSTELIAHPANDFVANFLGVDATLALQLRETGGAQLVLDQQGRPVGRVAQTGRTTDPAAPRSSADQPDHASKYPEKSAASPRRASADHPETNPARRSDGRPS
ncbi:ATP-binding cassette domain-containing protein [Propionimicrobium sp. PCR01-08-3]|uniref:ABC transporter ATP-binding protein n=1 Tax=Propionimicrobium sp. PCR01-08-3 TaxID=3052086 RepID=UPI003341CB79